MNPVVITVENVGKRYLLGHRRAQSDGFRHVVESALRAPFKRLFSRGRIKNPQREEFWALKHVSFEVNQGEVIGLIGPNGAGKSTLLKLLSRITEPTTGRLRLCGRVASLLEVGTGFHPELTGRENIFLNGAILGMGRDEIKKKFDEIVAFSEIEKFLDTPVKHYSSGMYVRLAFSVAAHLDPEILIVDEVLAVGDVAFQSKCFAKMEEVRARSRTVLFVSHNLAAIESFCHRGIVLRHGQVAFVGPSKAAIQFYLQGMRGQRAVSYANVVDLGAAAGRPAKYRPQLKRLELFDGQHRPLCGNLATGGSLTALIHVDLENAGTNVGAELGFFTLGGQRICTAHTAYDPNFTREKLAGRQVLVCQIPSLPLVPGEYMLRVDLNIALREADCVEDAARLKVVPADVYGTGILPTQGFFLLNNRWKLQSPEKMAGAVRAETHLSVSSCS